MFWSLDSYPDLIFLSVFLPAADIPSFVGKGDVDLGITGHDVVLESEMNGLVTEVLRLGFGKCQLQVQVPEASPIKTVDELAGKRVVSSFQVLSGDYFNKVDDRLQLAGETRTKIQYVGGSVEAACALGLADGIGRCLSVIYPYNSLIIINQSISLASQASLFATFYC